MESQKGSHTVEQSNKHNECSSVIYEPHQYQAESRIAEVLVYLGIFL